MGPCECQSILRYHALPYSNFDSYLSFCCWHVAELARTYPSWRPSASMMVMMMMLLGNYHAQCARSAHAQHAVVRKFSRRIAMADNGLAAQAHCAEHLTSIQAEPSARRVAVWNRAAFICCQIHFCLSNLWSFKQFPPHSTIFFGNVQ
jgi:hypothetical protein